MVVAGEWWLRRWERQLREIEDRRRAIGCRKLNLIVWEGEDDAMAFWTAIGYYREKTVEFAKELVTT